MNDSEHMRFRGSGSRPETIFLDPGRKLSSWRNDLRAAAEYCCLAAVCAGFGAGFALLEYFL